MLYTVHYTQPRLINQEKFSNCNKSSFKSFDVSKFLSLPESYFRCMDFLVIKSRKYVEVKPGRNSISEAVGVCTTQISRITKALEDIGAIYKEGISDLRTVIYRVNPYIYQNWQSFYRQIPSLSIAFLWSSKPAPVNNVSLIRIDKGIIGAFDAKCLSPMEQFYANWITQSDIVPEIKTQEQIDYANIAFSGSKQSVLPSSSQSSRPDASFLNIKIESATKEPVHGSPTIFVKNEDACRWPDPSQIHDIIGSLTQRLRVDISIFKY